MAIPRIIHTCWFGGGKKSDRLEGCLASQRAKLLGYEHKEWTEANTDFDEFPFLRLAWEKRRFAHLSDMVRLLALHRHGGIYLDTDVEVFRSFDPLLGSEFFCGYVWECMLGTAVIGSVPGHPILTAFLEPYLAAPGDVAFDLANNHALTWHFIHEVPGFRLDGRAWTGGGVRVLDRYAFEQPSLGRRKNYALHHFSASWRGESSSKRQAKALIIRLMGLYLYRKYNCMTSLRASRFRPEYERARALPTRAPT